jgi:hypothetical protein
MNHINDVRKSRKIEALLYNYLYEGHKNSKTICKGIKKTFILLLKHFLDKKIDVYTLEAFAGDIYFNIYKPKDFDNLDPKLSNALDTAADLSFYYKESKKNKKSLEKYKMLIDSLQQYVQKLNK